MKIDYYIILDNNIFVWNRKLNVLQYTTRVIKKKTKTQKKQNI